MNFLTTDTAGDGMTQEVWLDDLSLTYNTDVFPAGTFSFSVPGNGGRTGARLDFTPSVEGDYLETLTVSDGITTHLLNLDSSERSPDINGDGVVNVLDLVQLLLAFGSVGPGYSQDINGDGAVNVLDLVQLLLVFGQAV